MTSLLPSAWYVEPDAFARERRAIFADAWQMIARSDALARAGRSVTKLGRRGGRRCDASPKPHPWISRIRELFEPVWLGGAAGPGAVA